MNTLGALVCLQQTLASVHDHSGGCGHSLAATDVGCSLAIWPQLLNMICPTWKLSLSCLSTLMSSAPYSSPLHIVISHLAVVMIVERGHWEELKAGRKISEATNCRCQGQVRAKSAMFLFDLTLGRRRRSIVTSAYVSTSICHQYLSSASVCPACRPSLLKWTHWHWTCTDCHLSHLYFWNPYAETGNDH